MKTTAKITESKPLKKMATPKKISKLGMAIRKGKLKGLVVEVSDDPWNLK